MSGPTYTLAAVKKLVAMRRFAITASSLHSAHAIGLDVRDIIACVADLHENRFYKTMPSLRRPGTWQDVYRPTFAGRALYVKLQIIGTSPDDILVVISFKPSTAGPSPTRERL